MGFNAFFWLAFEQAGNNMTLFADRYTDASPARTVGRCPDVVPNL